MVKLRIPDSLCQFCYVDENLLTHVVIAQDFDNGRKTPEDGGQDYVGLGWINKKIVKPFWNSKF